MKTIPRDLWRVTSDLSALHFIMICQWTIDTSFEIALWISSVNPICRPGGGGGGLTAVALRDNWSKWNELIAKFRKTLIKFMRIHF